MSGEKQTSSMISLQRYNLSTSHRYDWEGVIHRIGDVFTLVDLGEHVVIQVDKEESTATGVLTDQFIAHPRGLFLLLIDSRRLEIPLLRQG